MRPVKLTPDFIPTAEGSVLIEVGQTRVICTASLEDSVPTFLKGSGKGWVTSEYGMLPRATEERTPRESTRGRPSGRTLEIQRLIGRSLRAVTDQAALGERTIWIDCDVIQADGGTRTASITGAFVAVALALERMVAAGILKSVPLRDSVAATSVGLVDETMLLDLAYEEDSRVQVDTNVIMTGSGRLAENALGKALHYSRFAEMTVIADDSGLVVPALGGAPGVHSARYGGPQASDADRIQKLLAELRSKGVTERCARFVCVLALALQGQVLAVFSDLVAGELLEAPRGSEGFGYDPIFFFPTLGRSFAELTREEKNQHSHRGKAFRKLLAFLESRPQQRPEVSSE